MTEEHGPQSEVSADEAAAVDSRRRAWRTKVIVVGVVLAVLYAYTHNRTYGLPRLAWELLRNTGTGEWPLSSWCGCVASIAGHVLVYAQPLLAWYLVARGRRLWPFALLVVVAVAGVVAVPAGEVARSAQSVAMWSPAFLIAAVAVGLGALASRRGASPWPYMAITLGSGLPSLWFLIRLIGSGSAGELLDPAVVHTQLTNIVPTLGAAALLGLILSEPPTADVSEAVPGQGQVL